MSLNGPALSPVTTPGGLYPVPLMNTRRKVKAEDNPDGLRCAACNHLITDGVTVFDSEAIVRDYHGVNVWLCTRCEWRDLDSIRALAAFVQGLVT